MILLVKEGGALGLISQPLSEGRPTVSYCENTRFRPFIYALIHKGAVMRLMVAVLLNRQQKAEEEFRKCKYADVNLLLI